MKNLIKNRTYWSEVWLRFRSDDQAAFVEIYEEFIDSLFAYGRKFTRDGELVKDCIQDVFLDLRRLQPTLYNPEYLEFYLFKSLKNAIFHKIGENKKLNRVPVEEIGIFDIKFQIEQDIFDSEYDQLRVEKLKEILKFIDPHKRELLFLKFYTGLSYVEIGQMLDMNPDTVKKQVYRTLNYIREKYGHRLIELLLIIYFSGNHPKI